MGTFEARIRVSDGNGGPTESLDAQATEKAYRAAGCNLGDNLSISVYE